MLVQLEDSNAKVTLLESELERVNFLFDACQDQVRTLMDELRYE